MAVIRTTRFTADPADAEMLLARRAELLAAVREAFAGPAAAHLVRLDGQTWLDIWQWDSPQALQAALQGAPGMPQAAAAFAVTRDASAEVGEVVSEDVWTR